MTLLSLVMIVKNESKIIERCFDSVKSIIDSIIISDTGSTDNTIEIIENYIKKNKLKGKVYKDEWKNFGHNRSKSITNAKEWLKENKYNLETTYFLTIDADMILKIKPSFKIDELQQKDSWAIQQINNSLTYYNKRIFRSKLAFKCIGVTHEHWGCDDKDEDDKLDDLYINDIGDGGAKNDKYERDIRLLTQGIIDEPKNERYFFYLAQSYCDSGNTEKAIEWYKKRIEAGGWNEEVFITYLRIGDIYERKKEFENAIHYWSLGYNHLPSRSETLYRIIRVYRHLGKNEIACLFLQTALQIPYPKDQLLFIEHNVYQYQLLEELSVCGYYTKMRKEGFYACNHLLFSKKNVPDIIKQQCKQNLFYYLQKLETEYKTISIETEQPYISSSLALLPTKEGFEGFVRAVNYSITTQFQYNIRDPQNYVKTKNYWIQMEKEFKQYELIEGPGCIKKRESNIQGLEDLRICKSNQTMYGLGITFEYGNHNHPSVCLCLFDKNDGKYFVSNVLPTCYEEHKVQKNWAPFFDKNLYAIYSHQPLTILQIDTETGKSTVAIQKESPLDLSDIRGSSSPVKINNDWIMIVHGVLQRDTRKYYHHFIMYDKDWNFKQISLPFYFEKLFVEFCLSISIDKEKQITIFYSKEDNESKMMKISYDKINWMSNCRNF